MVGCTSPRLVRAARLQHGLFAVPLPRNRNRVCACRSTGCSEAPPPVRSGRHQSIRRLCGHAPPPVQARPVISQKPRPGRRWPPDGRVIAPIWVPARIWNQTPCRRVSCRRCSRSRATPFGARSDDVDAAQPLHRADGFPAGDDQSQRIPLPRTYGFAGLGVGHQSVVHRFSQRNAHRVLVRLLPFGHDPACPRLDAALLQQHRQQHPVHSLQLVRPCTIWTESLRSPAQAAAVGVELKEVHPRYRGQAFYFIQREAERTVHHAVHQPTMLLGIDSDAVDVVHQEVESRRRDDPVQILRRCHQRGISDGGAWPGALRIMLSNGRFART